MRIFDDIIKKTLHLLSDKSERRYSYSPETAAVEGDKNELILSREAAFEMGEGKFPSVSYTLITEDDELVLQDETVLYGKELKEIKNNVPFARVTILKTDNMENLGEQAIYSIIKGIEMTQYDISPKGYMMRASALSNMERVRVSKNAVKVGLTFEQIGNLFIQKYKKNKYVKAVKIIFITLPDANYKELNKLADITVDRINAMNHLLADIKMDCKACEWKPVCDEVEGMKEMHMSMHNKNKEVKSE